MYVREIIIFALCEWYKLCYIKVRVWLDIIYINQTRVSSELYRCFCSISINLFVDGIRKISGVSLNDLRQ